MYKKYLKSIFFLLIPLFTWSQHDICITNEIMENSTDTISLSVNSIKSLNNEDFIYDKTLPVVVHVLHKGESYSNGSHITTLQVIETLEFLNQQFEGIETNGEYNTQITTCLIDVDEEGNPTNGINYYNVYDVLPNFDNVDISINYITIENAIEYDPTKYLNIYVVPWSGNPLGFSALPPYTLGIFMRTDVFIDTEVDVLSHELGHWCGLAHVFSKNTYNGQSYIECEETYDEVDCASDGDNVCDTPPTIRHFGCIEQCIDDPIDNYMHYSPNSCRDKFTTGQIERMHYMLDTYRPDVLQNTSCPENYEIDLNLISWENTNENCGTIISPKIYIKNQGIELNYIFNIIFDVYSNGDIVHTQNYNDVEVFLQDEIKEFNLPTFNLQYGDYDIVITLNVLNIEDQYTTNNNINTSLSIVPFTTLTMDINAGIFPSIQWRLYNDDGDGTPTQTDIVESCNWQSPPCWDYSEGTYEPTVLNFCLQEGCYLLKWRYTTTGSNNLNNCSGNEPCYVYVHTPNDTIIYDTYPQEGGTFDYYFCVENPIECPTYLCPWDLDDDGIVDVQDLVMEFLPSFNTEVFCDRRDFNNDGIIDNFDLLSFIEHFGYNCGTGEIMEGFTLPEWIYDFLNPTSTDDIFKEREIYQIRYYSVNGQLLNNTPSGLHIKMIIYVDGDVVMTKSFN